MNAGHYTTPHLELMEGNYSFAYSGDTYWGNSIYITVFRNWLSGLRAAHPPLNTYVFSFTSGNGTTCDLPYGDYTGRTAVGVQAYSYYQSFVGNVLGINGEAPLNNPYESQGCFYGDQAGFLLQITTGAVWNNQFGIDDASMWLFGPYQASVNSTGSWSFVDTTINTQTRTENWDWVTQAEHCYGLGGTTDVSCAGTTVPNSFYLNAKPAFFGSQTWPWVDPTTGTTYTLPAKYCFEHGLMPTCLQ
jgi:hypothetical protein